MNIAIVAGRVVKDSGGMITLEVQTYDYQQDIIIEKIINLKLSAYIIGNRKFTCRYNSFVTCEGFVTEDGEVIVKRIHLEGTEKNE